MSEVPVTPKPKYRVAQEYLKDLPIATYCTFVGYGAKHRLILVWDAEDGSPFWACLDCDPNALAEGWDNRQRHEDDGA